MSRAALPTWTFALVVVRVGQRFLLTQETKYGRSWTIPGGRVEPGENFVVAAAREVLEETGVPVRIDGILRIEHTPSGEGARLRIVFVGSPIDDTPPKQTADAESQQAAYLTLHEIRALPLRGTELFALLESVVAGRGAYPLDLLGTELSI